VERDAGWPRPDDLIREAADGTRHLSPADLDRVLRHVAAAGFDPLARETARGTLRGQMWDGQPITARTRLPPDVRHWLWHAQVNREWPTRTTLTDYVESLRLVILDPDSGVFINRYAEEVSLGFIRESRDLRGPDGYGWVLVQYRVTIGHWTTGFQPDRGLDELAKPVWGRIQWLRRPSGQSASRE